MSKSNIFSTLSSEEKLILSTLQKKGITSKEDLMNTTSLKGTTINRLLDQLKECELVLVCGEGQSTGGRKPLLYSLNAQKRIYGLGINITLQHLDIAVTDYLGNVVVYKLIKSNKEILPSEAIGIIKDELFKQLELHKISKEEIMVCGLSISCAIDRSKGVILDSLSRNFTDRTWISFPVKEVLERELDMRVTVETTANSGCIGEYLFGYGRNHQKVCYVICGGNNIRMGCISQGRIIRPTNDLDDAFGHMVVVADGEKCICGNYGCIDSYSSASAIVKNFLLEIKKGRPSLLDSGDIDSITIDDILKAAENNDFLAMEVISKAAGILGVGLANYVNLFDPEVVICAGLLIEESSLYFKVLESVVNKKTSYLRKTNNIVFKKRSDMGKAVIGASIMALESIFDNHY